MRKLIFLFCCILGLSLPADGGELAGMIRQNDPDAWSAAREG